VGVEGGSGLLDGVDDGVVGGQLVHVDLHSLVSHDERLHSNLLRLAC
jgi:hypothetical protein